jgi:hypothetical protein
MQRVWWCLTIYLFFYLIYLFICSSTMIGLITIIIIIITIITIIINAARVVVFNVHWHT